MSAGRLVTAQDVGDPQGNSRQCDQVAGGLVDLDKAARMHDQRGGVFALIRGCWVEVEHLAIVSPTVERKVMR
jgi:hypothetical protein